MGDFEDTYTPEERARFTELCNKIDALCREPELTYEQAFMALTSVLSQLCTECDDEVEACLSVCEDLMAEFRGKMANRPTETDTIIPEPDQN